MMCVILFHWVRQSRTARYVPEDAVEDFEYALENATEKERSRGFLFSAVGERSLREAAVSALSLRSALRLKRPNISVVTDSNGIEWLGSRPDVRRVFDQAIHSQMKDRTWGFRSTKISAYLMTPYDFTMFLDSDTLFCDTEAVPHQLANVWSVLERFEFAGRRTRGCKLV
jgi:uncharacterized lipoprotein YajG